MTNDLIRSASNTVDWGIPSLDPRMLSSVIPQVVYGGGRVRNPPGTLFLWRSCRTQMAQGGTLGFFLDDARLEALWRAPAYYAKQFTASGIRAVVEVDFSLWIDDALAVQVHNTYRTRALSRYWQEHGLAVVPSLNWGDERSYEFAFSGIPKHAPVVATECRTAGKPEDREGFIAGLMEAVRQVEPRTVLIYGGTTHRGWLEDRLRAGPTYLPLDSWTTARRKFMGRDKFVGTPRRKVVGLYQETAEQ